MQVQLFSNFTLHHLITHTNPKSNISEYNEPRMKQTDSFDFSRKKILLKRSKSVMLTIGRCQSFNQGPFFKPIVRFSG